ncbi:MAG: hypothetical protein J5379_08865 [Clostridiales bacterium]|nr:hypothetical protein [Clostridiales bacterium]
MGLFDLFSKLAGGFNDEVSNAGSETYGYKKFKNPKGWDNAKMLELLSGEESTLGTPRMGWIRAFGKERQVIVYDWANDVNYVYVDAQPKKIIVSMAPKPGQIGGAKDHVEPGEEGITDPNTVKATLGTMSAVDEIVGIVDSLLKKA